MSVFYIKKYHLSDCAIASKVGKQFSCRSSLELRSIGNYFNKLLRSK